MKKQSGITLVALIITIIVMAILVGVVLLTSVMEGGIIDRAEDALVEKERAELEEIIIGSYVYKKSASMNNVLVQLDLEETAKALYSNLEETEYKLKTSSGTDAQSYEDIFPEGATTITLKVEGKRGTYEGIVEKTGLKDGIKPVKDGESVVPPVDEEEDLPEGEESAVAGDFLNIGAIEDLVELSLEVNNGNSCEGETVKLLTSLDFKNASSYRTENPETTKYVDKNGSEVDINGDGNIEPIMTELTTGKGFTPIGQIDLSAESEGIQFKGNFNGNKKTIKNLYINRPEEEAALFRSISANTIIQELTLENPNIYGFCSAGIAMSTDMNGTEESALKLEKCHIKNGKIGMVNENGVSQLSCGLIYALSMGNIDVINCTNSSTISGIQSSGIGNLMGFTSVYVDGCSNSGNIIIENEEKYIEGTGEAGSLTTGIAVVISPSESIVKNCTNSGTLYQINGRLSGVVDGTGVNISDCSNTGDLIVNNAEGSISVAGIYNDPGYEMAEGLEGKIERVQNDGDITISTNQKLRILKVSGVADTSDSIIDSTNNGNINVDLVGFIYADGGYVAGIGSSRKEISNCTNNGNITYSDVSGFYVDGIAFDTGADLIKECTNNGTITKVSE